MNDFRIWEGALATCLGAASLLTVLTIHGSKTGWTWQRVILTALLAAFTLFVAPIFGLAAYAAAGLSVLTTAPPRRWLGTALIAALILAAVISPWALRNNSVMGSPVLLRDNFGLELALAFHSNAQTDAPKTTFFARQAEIHPMENPDVIARMHASGGEISYNKMLLKVTQAWMLTHPMETLSIIGLHVREYLFPPLWVMELNFKSAPAVMRFRQGLFWIISALAVMGAIRLVLDSITACVRRNGAPETIVRLLFPIPFYIGPIALYSLTQPTMRYSYMVYALSLFLGAALFDTLRADGTSERSAPAKTAIPPAPEHF